MKKLDLYGGSTLAKVLHYYGFPSSGEKIICPFHEDVNPSMAVNLEEGSCYCFGCNKSYTAIQFVKEVEKVDDLSACMLITKLVKSDKVKNINVTRAKQYKQSSKDSLAIAQDYYFCLSKTNWREYEGEEKEYMIERGFDPSVLMWCRAKLTYNQSYPIVFPMFDNNEFKGWVCRTTTKSIEKKRKYLYNEGFSRATTLCGAYASCSTVVICEGYMDMLKLRQFGLKNVVAILGWKITSHQIEKLKNAGITDVISALDTDECGKKGTSYLSNFFNVTRFEFPKGVKDPGDMSRSQASTAIKLTKQKIRNRRTQNGSSR